MTTNLKKYSDAYATMTVAVYEPLILKWLSGWTILLAAELMTARTYKAKAVDLEHAMSTASALRIPRAGVLAEEMRLAEVGGAGRPGETPRPMDVGGHPIPPEAVRRVDLPGFPNAVQIGTELIPEGIVDVDPTAQEQDERLSLRRLFRGGKTSRKTADLQRGAATIPLVTNRRIGAVAETIEFHRTKSLLASQMLETAKKAVDLDDVSFANAVLDSFKVAGVGLYDFLPTIGLKEALSPIGIAHYYRQLFYNLEEGVGPIEEAFTIAPNETLEVMYESVRRQVHEEIVEVGEESVSENAIEQRNLDEVSDKTASMVQRDTSASMSAFASGSIAVWSASASATASFSTSSQRSTELATKQLREVTTRASERLSKSFSIKTRSLEELTTTNVTRRVIANETTAPVSYGLRRVLRKVHVKVQSMGPRLVWQLYVRNPGRGLALSRFVHFRETGPITVPDIPPGVPPPPKGGLDQGTGNVSLRYSTEYRTWFAKLQIRVSPDRVVTGVSIDAVTDLESDKDDDAPAPKNHLQWGSNWDASDHTYTVNIGIHKGDSDAVTVSYTYSYDPSDQVMAEWEQLRSKAQKELEEELLTEQFERNKTLITQKSKIRPRPANELRQEERYEVMNRLVSGLFGRGDDPAEPTPLEIESFHRYFDIRGMFVYMHPAWWKPRFTNGSDGLPRPAYEITAESDPAPLGSSLGWLIQLDGDNRRQEFLNSPWYRVCLPMRLGRERAAIQWLSKHIEGDVGYDPDAGALKQMLEAIEDRHDEEEALGTDGPEWITVDATVGAPEEAPKPQKVFPVVAQFDITVPTDGFVYDELVISGN